MKRYDQIPGPRSTAVWQDLKKKMATGMSPLAYQLPIAFERAEGDILFDVDGNSYIDWDGGVLTCSTGHCNASVRERLKSQIDKLWSVHDYPTNDKLNLVRRLDGLLPQRDYAYQFYSGGSETMEAAIRAGLSFQGYRKRKILSFSEGYHGKTRGSLMAVHSLFGKRVQPDYLSPRSIPFPKCYECPYAKHPSDCELYCAQETARVIDSEKGIGLFVFEPILGTGGIFGPPAGFWDIVQVACKNKGVLLVADEITTGVFRTGTFLACEQFGIEPDLVAVGKGIASGFPAMVLAGGTSLMQDDQIDNDNLDPGRPMGTSFTAPGGASTTFGGSPLAVAAMLATLEELEKSSIGEHVAHISRIFEDGFRELQGKYDCIADVRCYGLLIGVTVSMSPISQADQKMDANLGMQLYRECAHHGLFIKPDQKGIIHITPPLTMSESNAKQGLEIFDYALSRVFHL